MKKKQFFQIVENNDLSEVSENSLLDLSANSIVEFNNIEKTKKKNFNEIQLSHNVSKNVTKRNALNFLGLCSYKKTIFNNLQGKNDEYEKSTLDAHEKCSNPVVKNGLGENPKCLKYTNENCLPNYMSSCTREFCSPTQFHCNKNNGNDDNNVDDSNTPLSKGSNEKDKNVHPTVSGNENMSRLYCLEQIIHNNLNNNYDKNEVKLFHIYHDNRAECLFSDISVIKFYGHENMCVYENKSYIYNEINANLFHEKDTKENGEHINIDNDIYEYLYREKMKLNNPNNKDKAYYAQYGVNEKSGNCHEQPYQCFQFYMHKYPPFLREKIKIFIHLYNMFSIYPYINHNFVEEEMYSKNLKITSSFEKVVHIKWRFYDEKELKNMLHCILSKKKRENYSQENFLQLDDYVSVNFLTQEVKVRDISNMSYDTDTSISNSNAGIVHNNVISDSVHNSSNTDASFNCSNHMNYILLNGNGLCFSAHYHIIVPYHRRINKSIDKTDIKNNNNYNLTYEYIYLSQLFNIYDNFHVCFLYPLFISYFFYYHLFVKERIRGICESAKLSTTISGITKASPGIFEKNCAQNGDYTSTLEEAYTNQLNDTYIKLTNCVKGTISNIQNGNFKIKNDVIEFLIPQSCYKNCEELQYLDHKSHYLPLLYVVCISKHSVGVKIDDINSDHSYNGNRDVYHPTNHRNICSSGIDNLTCSALNSLNTNNCYLYGNSNFDKCRGSYSSEGDINKRRTKCEMYESERYDNSLCCNEVKEFNNLRTIFPIDMKPYFNTCNKIDNIIKVSIRNDGVCFIYVKNIFSEYIFSSYFILFNSFENLVHLMNTGKKGSSHICGNNLGYLHQNDEIGKGASYISHLDCNKNDSIDAAFTRTDLETCGLLTGNLYTTNNIQYYNDFYNNMLEPYKLSHNVNFRCSQRGEAPIFANIDKIFEIRNINNIYNDFYICENKNMNSFKLINLMNKEKKKILTPYYFEKSELTPLFFVRLSNIHIYDINRQLNSVFEYINYNNKTFTPFLKNFEQYEMNVQLDLLENMYNINNELYLLYTKKINYSHDIYKYNYLYVQDYLLKNYILYNNIYFHIKEDMKKNEYYKLKYTNKNKQTISVHFTISFNYVYDKINSYFLLKPRHYITHLEHNSPTQQIDTENFISFINKYVNSKKVK